MHTPAERNRAFLTFPATADECRAPGERARDVRAVLEARLDRLAAEVEHHIDNDVMAIIGPIYPGLDEAVRGAIEARKFASLARRRSLAIVLQTDGGVIEVVERMVSLIRHHYDDVTVIVLNSAMSAGTVFALSADRIMMNYYSCLGPVDPQIVRHGLLVPALSYLVQFERLKERSRTGELTSLEAAMLLRLDLAELHRFEMARELSNTLLKEWLAKYKFKDWSLTETRGVPVTAEMRERRALEVARKLMDHEHWGSHGRPVSMEVLRRDLKLQIDDLAEAPELNDALRAYYTFLNDFMAGEEDSVLVHTRGACFH